VHQTDDKQQPQIGSSPEQPVQTRSSGQSIDDVANGLRALANASPPAALPPTGDGVAAEIERQNRRAVVYDELYEVIQPCFRAYEDWTAEAIYSAWYEGRGRLLLVGCGTGAQLQRLAQRMPVKLITAIDVSPQMARRAREKAPGVPEVRTVAFANYQPVVPFDVVAFTGALAAMPDLRAAAEHTARMTLHGSRVVICARNGGWAWQEEAQQRPARWKNPSWYWARWRNQARIATAAKLSAELDSPHAPLTQARIGAGFEGRFGLRHQRSSFGVTRLFENVLAVPHEQALETVGQTRERRPWMRSLERLHRLDEAFEKSHPMGGGVLAMLYDKLH
jgi:SAM-dependent methyltransferase